MSSFAQLLPEAYLFATVLGLILGESANFGEKLRLVLPTSLLGIAGAAIQTVLAYQGGPAEFFGGTIVLDGFALFFKLAFLVLAAIVVCSACLGEEIAEGLRAEFCAILLLGTIALMVAASATSLFVILIALQLAGGCGYFLAGFNRDASGASKAALKWFFCSLFSGAFLLFGFLALFVLAGTANVQEIHHQLASHGVSSTVALFSFAVVFLGLSLPLFVFPSQFWVPEVLEEANSPAGAYLVLGLRAGAFAVATRIWVAVFSVPGASGGVWAPLSGWDWTAWIALSAGLTMILPALLAIRQTHAKRLLACMAVAQSGFLLLGLLVLEEVGFAAVLFNLLVDLLAFGGLLFVLSLCMGRGRSAELKDLRGALRGRPWEAVLFVVFFVAWLGIPPFAGAIGRFALIGAAVRREWFTLAFLSLLAMALSVGAAGRLMLSLLHLGGELPSSHSEGGIELSSERRGFLLALLIPLVGATVFANSLLQWAGQSLKFIFR
ncbi:MAG: NADH-quinone oxidoreductase chain dehydrogenase chain chain [Pseudomonadota bacterium]|jgi:NADH-quinone oxidoreductase subunit N